MADSGRAVRTKRSSVSFLDKADSTNSNAFVAACTCGQPEQPWCSIDDLTHILLRTVSKSTDAGRESIEFKAQRLGSRFQPRIRTVETLQRRCDLIWSRRTGLTQ